MGGPRRCGLGGVGGVQQPRGELHETPTGRRESPEAAGVALNQGDTQRGLKPLDPLCQCGHRNAELVGSAPEVPRVGDGDEGLDSGQVEIHDSDLPTQRH